jgi:hypothetical protein
MLKKYEDMRKNGTIFKFEEIFGMNYEQLKGDESELNLLVAKDESEEEDIFTKQYSSIR